MADQLPINTATATVKVLVDRADYDALKKEMEADFADFKEKFAGIFKVQFESILAPIADMLAKLEKLAPNVGQTQALPQQSAPPVADQTLEKLTRMQQTMDDMAGTLQTIADSLMENED